MLKIEKFTDVCMTEGMHYMHFIHFDFVKFSATILEKGLLLAK